MIGPAVATRDATVSVTAYEHLRGHVLAGTSAAVDAHAVLLLMRDGIAAWLERGTARAAAPAVRERSVDGPLAAADLHASLIRTVATLAMSTGGERRSRR